MRSTAAAALLSACGLCAPLETGSKVRRFDHIFVRGASSDVPIEQKSAFGAEVGDVSALLSCCTEKSLVFVDELGRGTSPRDGTRLAGAVLEDMALQGMSGMFSTHLHDMLQLPFEPKAANRIVRKQMAITDKEWSFRVEDGFCTDSLALETAEKFGLPDRIIKRAEELGKYIPESNFSLASAVSSSNRNPSEPSLDHAASLAKRYINAIPTKIPAKYDVPPWLSGKSVVYILKLANDPPSFYVGQTDNLHQRIAQHRHKVGIQWKNLEAIAFQVSNKTEAVELEKLLIQMMAAEGYLLESIRCENGHVIEWHKEA